MKIGTTARVRVTTSVDCAVSSGTVMIDAIDVTLPNLDIEQALSDEQIAGLRELNQLLSESMPKLFGRDGGITDAPEWEPIRELAQRLLLTIERSASESR